MKLNMHPAYWRSLFAAAALFLFGVAAFAQQAAAPKAEPSSEPKRASAQTPTAVPRGGGDLLSEIKRSGKLRVGVSEIVPWATHIGVEPEFYPEEFRYLIPDLLAGRFDIIISGLSINASRALQVDGSKNAAHIGSRTRIGRRICDRYAGRSCDSRSLAALGMTRASVFAGCPPRTRGYEDLRR